MGVTASFRKVRKPGTFGTFVWNLRVGTFVLFRGHPAIGRLGPDAASLETSPPSELVKSPCPAPCKLSLR
jgi:hypothetical protein